MEMESRAGHSVAAKKIQKNCSARGKTSQILERIIEFQLDTFLDRETLFGIVSCFYLFTDLLFEICLENPSSRKVSKIEQKIFLDIYIA
jgi:hypothetical protein